MSDDKEVDILGHGYEDPEAFLWAKPALKEKPNVEVHSLGIADPWEIGWDVI